MATENMILTEAPVQTLEKAKEEKMAMGEIETEHPGYLTYCVGTIKGVGRIYQQTFIDTYTKVAFTKLYDRKNAIVAADMLNDRVLPFFEQEGVRLLRVLTDQQNIVAQWNIMNLNSIWSSRSICEPRFTRSTHRLCACITR